MSLLKKESKNGRLGDILPSLKALQIDKSRRILVTSGSGVIGYRVAMSLLEAGHTNIRVGIYNSPIDRGDESCGPQCAEVLRAKGAQVVDFDWTKEADFDEALKDIQTVFCTIPHAEGWQDVFPKFVRKCMYKHVQHFVKVSFLRPNNPTTSIPNGCASGATTSKAFNDMALQYREKVPFCRFHGTCDDYLMQVARLANDNHPMSYTILACAHLMSEPLFRSCEELRQNRKFVTASYSMGVNYVSPNSVADAAVAVMVAPCTAHANRVYNLTGPGPTTDAQVAKLLLKLDEDHPVQHVALGYHEYIAYFIKRDPTNKQGRPSAPAWHINDNAAMERMKAMGLDELPTSYTKDLETLTGKKPESFESFLKDQQDHMRPGMVFP